MSILERLDLNSINAGTWSGGTSIQASDGKLIESINEIKLITP